MSDLWNNDEIFLEISFMY